MALIQSESYDEEMRNLWFSLSSSLDNVVDGFVDVRDALHNITNYNPNIGSNLSKIILRNINQQLFYRFNCFCLAILIGSIAFGMLACCIDLKYQTKRIANVKSSFKTLVSMAPTFILLLLFLITPASAMQPNVVQGNTLPAQMQLDYNKFVISMMGTIVGYANRKLWLEMYHYCQLLKQKIGAFVGSTPICQDFETIRNHLPEHLSKSSVFDLLKCSTIFPILQNFEKYVNVPAQVDFKKEFLVQQFLSNKLETDFAGFMFPLLLKIVDLYDSNQLQSLFHLLSDFFISTQGTFIQQSKHLLIQDLKLLSSELEYRKGRSQTSNVIISRIKQALGRPNSDSNHFCTIV